MAIWYSEFTHVTADTLDGWTTEDAPPSALLDAFRAGKASDFTQAAAHGEWQRLAYELCGRVVEGKVSPALAVGLLRQVPGEGEAMDVDATADFCPWESFADALWVLSLQFGNKTGAEWGRLRDLTAALAKSGLVPDAMLKRLVDTDLLAATGLIPDADGFDKRLKKINTDQVYRQQKYNLLGEETEGYSKLLTLLGSLNAAELDQGVSNMLSLIGYFDLDPNRVFDLVLEAFEMDLDNRAVFLRVVGLFKKSSLPHIVGFKFQHCASRSTPRSLFRLAALLVADGAMTLESIMAHTSPSLDAMAKTHAQRRKVLQQQADQFGQVKLNADNAAAGAQAQSLPQFGDNNQVLGLLQALLEMRSWSSAMQLLDALGAAGCGRESVAAHPSLRQQLCTLLHDTVEPLYSQCSSSGKALRLVHATGSSGGGSALAAGGDAMDVDDTPSGLPKLTDFRQFPELVIQPLSILGLQLCHDVQLYVKLCRLVLSLLKNHSDLWEDRAFRASLTDLLQGSLLPVTSLLGGGEEECAPPGLVIELWNALNVLPYEVRCELYLAWHTAGEDHTQQPELKLAKAKAAGKVSQVLKRIANDNKNVKSIGRQLAKIAHANPTVAFERILKHASSYENFIGPVVQSLAFMSPLSLDVLSFMMIHTLAASTKSTVDQAHAGSSAGWFKNMALFAGVFYKANPTVEIQGLLHFVLKRLNAGSSQELLIVKELLARVGGCDVVEDITDQQLQGLGGGDALRRELIPMEKQSKRAVVKLRDALLTPQTGLPLLVLIAQQRNVILFHNAPERGGAQLKVVGKLFDVCQLVLVQLIEFLSKQREAYATILPTFSRLCQSYHLEPQVAFLASRPLIRAAWMSSHPSNGGAAADGSGSGGASSGPLAQWSSREPDSPLITQVMEVVPASAWEYLSPSLYCRFWGLSLQDITVPDQIYAKHQQQLKTKEQELLRPAFAAPGPLGVPPGVERDSHARKKDAARVAATAEALRQELEEQTATVARVRSDLEAEKDHYFAKLPVVLEQTRREQEGKDKEPRPDLPKPTAIVIAIVEHMLQFCILPRLLLTPEDAVFCAKMIFLLHDMHTPQFSTLQLCDRVVKVVVPTVFCITEREANNLGIFLRTLLEPLARWDANAKVYRKEAESKPGFAIKAFKQEMGKATHLQYHSIFFSWNARITTSLAASLDSTEYLEKRAGINVLLKLTDVFPIFASHFETIYDRISPLANKQTNSEFPDLLANCVAYKAKLDKNRATMKADPPSKEDKARKQAAKKKEEAAAAAAAAAPPPSASAAGDKGQAKPPPRSSPSRGSIPSSSSNGSSSGKSGSSGKTEASSRGASGSRKSNDGAERDRSGSTSPRDPPPDLPPSSGRERSGRSSATDNKVDGNSGKSDGSSGGGGSNNKRSRAEGSTRTSTGGEDASKPRKVISTGGASSSGGGGSSNDRGASGSGGGGSGSRGGGDSDRKRERSSGDTDEPPPDNKRPRAQSRGRGAADYDRMDTSTSTSGGGGGRTGGGRPGGESSKDLPRRSVNLGGGGGGGSGSGGGGGGRRGGGSGGSGGGGGPDGNDRPPSRGRGGQPPPSFTSRGGPGGGKPDREWDGRSAKRGRR